MRQPRHLLTLAPERALGRLLAEHEAQTVMVVAVDRDGYRDVGERLTSLIDGDVGFHIRAASTDDVTAIEELVIDLKDSAPDAVLAVGGGSVHDLVKAAFAAASTGDLHSAISTFEPPATWIFPRLTIRRPLFVTVPSTFSGSEANGHAGFRSARMKRIISSDALVPDVVVIDPEALRLSPPWLLVESLFNAMNHAIEAVASPRQGALTQVASIGGAAVIGEALRDDPDGWTDRQLGSLSAASVLITAGQSGTTLGLAHAIPHVLGAHLGVRHSLGHAVTAAAVLRFNGRGADQCYVDLARAFGAERGEGAVEALAEVLEQAARRHLGAVTLTGAGVSADDIPAILTALEAEPGYHLNPRPVPEISVLGGLLEDLL